MYYSYGYSSNIGLLLVFIGFLITLCAQLFLNSCYSKYKKVNVKKRISGYETARIILDNNGLSNVKINRVSGNLTDHYDPRSKCVNLSSDIYDGNSVASVAVAAHECGHAIQDKDGYFMLKLRSSIVPIVNLSTRIGYFVIMISLLARLFDLAMIGFILIMASLVFQLITLPVEFNASSRAKKQVYELNLVSDKEHSGISKVLFAAALTYVAAVLNTIMQLLRMFLMIMGNRDRR